MYWIGVEGEGDGGSYYTTYTDAIYSDIQIPFIFLKEHRPYYFSVF